MNDPRVGPNPGGETAATGGGGWELLRDVPLTLAVEVGRATLKVRDLVGLEAGSLVMTAKRSGEVMDVSLDGRVFGRAEVLVRRDRLAARLTEVVGGDR